MLKQRSLHGAMSSLGRIHGSRNQEIEAEVTSLAIRPNVPPRSSVLPGPTTLLFFFFFLSYLAVPGVSCGTWDLYYVGSYL